MRVAIGLVIVTVLLPIACTASSLPESTAAFAWGTLDGKIYLFGGDVGHDKPTREIVTGVDGEWSRSGDRMPGARWAQTAVATGDAILVFGGADPVAKKPVTEILSYAPGSDATVVAHLPSGRDWMSSVWDPRPSAACPKGCAYLFGGGSSSGPTADILRYNPVSRSTSAMTAHLPTPRWGTGAAWDGQFAYVVGGLDGLSGSAEIVRFDPTRDEAKVVGLTGLPVADAAVAWHDNALFIAGGHMTDERFGRVSLLRWRPMDLVALPSCAPLSHPVYKAALVPQGNALALVGGFEDLAGLDDQSSSAVREVDWTSCLELDGIRLPEVVPIVSVLGAEARQTVDVLVAQTRVSWTASDQPIVVGSVIEASLAKSLPGLPEQNEPLPYVNLHVESDGEVGALRVDFALDDDTDVGQLTVYSHGSDGWRQASVSTTSLPSAGSSGPTILAWGRTPGHVWAEVDGPGLFAVGKEQARVHATPFISLGFVFLALFACVRQQRA